MHQLRPGLHADGTRPSVVAERAARRIRMYVWGNLVDVTKHLDNYAAID